MYTDPSGHSFSDFVDDLFDAAVGTFVGLATGNPALGFAVYSGMSGATNAIQNGGNVLQGLVIGTVSGMTGYGVGNFVGASYGPFAGAVAGGASGGATGAALGGGDIGRAALAGGVGGAFGYFGPVGALVGGGVGASIAGGNFWEGVAGSGAFLAGTYIGQRFSTIPQAISKIKGTDWADTYEGSQVVDGLGKAQWRGMISFGETDGARAYFDPSTGKIVVSNSESIGSIPGRLTHEGTHLWQNKLGQPYGFLSERQAFSNAFMVDKSLNVSGAFNPSDNWIRDEYGF